MVDKGGVFSYLYKQPKHVRTFLIRKWKKRNNQFNRIFNKILKIYIESDKEDKKF